MIPGQAMHPEAVPHMQLSGITQKTACASGKGATLKGTTPDGRFSVKLNGEWVGNMENKLAQIRREKKIGQGYLVDMLGVSRQTISSIENGRCTPSLELALDLADLLGLPLEELFIHENRFLQQS